MSDKTYLVKFKASGLPPFAVVAASVEIQGDQLALVDSQGRLAALFLIELVESWNVLPEAQEPNQSVQF